MNFEKNKLLKKWYIAIWLKESKYLDCWSVNHVLLGCVLFGLFNLLHFSLNINFLLSLLVMIAWEFYEFFKNVYEIWQNKIIDIFLGLTGFSLTAYAINFYAPKIIFLITLFLFVSLEIWGIYAFAKNGKKFI